MRTLLTICTLSIALLFSTTCGYMDQETFSKRHEEFLAAKADNPINGQKAESQPAPVDVARASPRDNRPLGETNLSPETVSLDADLAYRLSQEPIAPSPSIGAQIGNKALSLAGIPAILPDGTKVTQEETYLPETIDKITGKFERLNRNPDGSYGAQSSSVLDLDAQRFSQNALREAVSAGSGVLNSWAEGWLSGFGRAKVNVTPSLDGNVTGSIDFLTPIYDSEFTSVLSQFGLRTMPGDRIVSNMGLVQRFFKNEMAFGYNAFLDQDFTRGHIRGGLGVEFWYDWLRLASNYYRPLSNWKDSRDYDPRYVQERPAEGWDARLTGFLPFYRNLAFNTAVEEWFGRRVAPFGQFDRLANNPKVLVLGLDWTPVPMLTFNGETRTSNDHTETRLGMTFNYHFGVPIEEQLTASKVNELRSIENSRHDFVNRQNEMLLEYRAKPGTYIVNITSLGIVGGKMLFRVNITDYFGEPVKGEKVRFKTL
jgi:hypothetical protein